ncbi:hypothetical protein A0068_06625 [Campylobacter lari]|uniref:Tetratricopeptide repeat protein n=1 Tax=Campylobacter subantarcticus TaxID=497724 RepID=A0ABW9N382_9BACT|nr:hypothetical protein [Campylobacter subantarcticus]EAL3939338.1 hypothetical protein [Campylobacter lari]MPB98698.1 hypothetical protein [Campylobacter subantarcticus]
MFKRAYCAKELESYEELIAYCDAVHNVDKNNFKLYLWQGIAKYNLSLEEEAIKDLNKALKIDKNHNEAKYYKGALL